MFRLTLSQNDYTKLTRLVKERDAACAQYYFYIIGAWPPRTGGQVHHVIFRAAGGPDREDNLITLSRVMHIEGVHEAPRGLRTRNTCNFKMYLQCEGVRQWRADHRKELEALYKKAEERRAKKIRNGCIPKKPPWAKF